MCGIIGYFGPSPRQTTDILHSLAHRGPDSNGEWTTQLPTGHSLQLLHTRLAILDLSAAGHQPMCLRRIHDGTWQTGSSSATAPSFVLSYNGEIYNHTPLRAELQSLGHHFAGHSDTEVLLRGYAQWGLDVFARLDGIFAALLYDAPAHRLIATRDHLGIKPLYYAHDSSGGLLFASEVRTVLSSSDVSSTLDPVALHDYLRLGSIQEPRTLFTAIRAFPPGSVATIDLSSPTPVELKTHKYWSPESFATAESTAAACELVSQHASLLRATVAEQLIADVPVGIFLSGGIDSTLLLETAAAHDRERITAFTVGGGMTEHDETTIAAQTAANLGVRHQVVHLSEAQQHAWVAAALAAMDQPSADGINTYLVSRASREAGLIVALGGTGADEFHGAYGYAATLARVARVFRNLGPLARPAKKTAAAMLGLRHGPVARERLSQLLATTHSPTGLIDEKRRFFTPSQIDALWPHTKPTPSRPAAAPHLTLEKQIILAETSGYLRNTLLRDADWATMANAQELRVPFLGRRYVEFMLNLPTALLAAQGTVKKPLLANLISPANRALIARPKTGFSMNYAAMLTGPLRDALHASFAKLNAEGFTIDAEARLRELSSPDAPKRANRLWSLFALGTYLQRQKS